MPDLIAWWRGMQQDHCPRAPTEPSVHYTDTLTRGSACRSLHQATTSSRAHPDPDGVPNAAMGMVAKFHCER